MHSCRRGSYSGVMISECRKYGMKPVCEHPSYCKNDKSALYLGQSGHTAYPGHRNSNNYWPRGWSSIRGNWDGPSKRVLVFASLRS